MAVIYHKRLAKRNEASRSNQKYVHANMLILIDAYYEHLPSGNLT